MNSMIRSGSVVIIVAASVLGAAPLHAADAPAPAPAPAPATAHAGTQIIGEQEAPVGLVLMPWQADQPATLDARPTHRQESLEPLDTEAFRQRVITDEAIAAYRRAGLRRD